MRDGTARNWTQDGFDIEWVDGLIAEDLHADGNGTGIVVANGRLSDCTADRNVGAGVRSPGGSTISGCAAKNNQDAGFILLNGSTLQSCTAVNNQAAGIDVRASTVDGCATYGNNYGIAIAFNGNVRNNTVSLSASDGIRVASS